VRPAEQFGQLAGQIWVAPSDRLLIAPDDRLADLLQWPELAKETTLLRR
jgi:hypothetical protein